MGDKSVRVKLMQITQKGIIRTERAIGLNVRTNNENDQRRERAGRKNG